MLAATNHKPVPFLDRIPPRAKAAVERACELIKAPNSSASMTHKIMCAELAKLDVEGPTLREFEVWFAHVLASVGGSDRSATNPMRVLQEIGTEIGQELAKIADDAVRLEQAKAIVIAAHGLFEAKVAGGYSPLSVALDDTIVAEALKEVIEAEASAQIMDADIHMTPGNKLVDLLLGLDDEDVDAKLVDVLTMDMQQELCAILIKSGLAEGEAA